MYLVISIKQLYLSLIVFLAESDDEEGEYIAEDRETKTKRNRKTAQRVQTGHTPESETKSWGSSNPPRRGC